MKLHGTFMATYPNVTLMGYRLLKSKLFLTNQVRLMAAYQFYGAPINLTKLVLSEITILTIIESQQWKSVEGP